MTNFDESSKLLNEPILGSNTLQSEPKTGSTQYAPKIGAMKNLRLSIHSDEYQWLRERFLIRRQELGLTQRTLGEKMGVLYSFIGKVETGDRRLDIFEFIAYCEGLELEPEQVLREIREKFSI